MSDRQRLEKIELGSLLVLTPSMLFAVLILLSILVGKDSELTGSDCGRFDSFPISLSSPFSNYQVQYVLENIAPLLRNSSITVTLSDLGPEIFTFRINYSGENPTIERVISSRAWAEDSYGSEAYPRRDTVAIVEDGNVAATLLGILRQLESQGMHTTLELSIPIDNGSAILEGIYPSIPESYLSEISGGLRLTVFPGNQRSINMQFRLNNGNGEPLLQMDYTDHEGANIVVSRTFALPGETLPPSGTITEEVTVAEENPLRPYLDVASCTGE